MEYVPHGEKNNNNYIRLNRTHFFNNQKFTEGNELAANAFDNNSIGFPNEAVSISSSEAQSVFDSLCFHLLSLLAGVFPYTQTRCVRAATAKKRGLQLACTQLPASNSRVGDTNEL